MQFNRQLTDAAVLAELGRRLARHRLERNWTQAELAAQAGVGQATVQRAERGESVQMTSMVRLLRALELLSGFDAAVPESIELPIARLEREQRSERRRATGSRGERTGRGEAGALNDEEEQRWSWGEERSGSSSEQLDEDSDGPGDGA